MRVLTDAQAAAWCEARGLHVNGTGVTRSLSYGGEHYCLAIRLPSEGSRLVALGYVVLMTLLGDDDEANFQGTLLWLRDWAIWSETIDRVGWKILTHLRASETTVSSLEDAPAQLFDTSEFVAAHAALLQPLLFQWDAYLIPPSGTYFGFISHEEMLYLVTERHDVFTALRERFDQGQWGPEQKCPPYLVGE